jgi:hypothetical protein
LYTKAKLGICIAILNSTSKKPLSFLLCLCLLFKKIRDKGRTGSAWKPEGGRRERVKEMGDGQGGEMTPIMYTHVNK